MRRGKSSTTRGQPRGQIIDAISIRERPAEVEDRAIPGHWEGDLLTGGKNSHIATLVERQSRFVILVKVPAKDTNSVVDALVRQVKQLPAGLMSSLTWDRGTELADHKRFSVATDVSVYFCDPQSPWQRGSNENTNGLLRQYFPKGTELSGHSQKDLDAVARQLNTRPRKPWLHNARGYARAECCVDRLNPLRPTSRRNRREVRFHSEAPGDLAGGMVVRGARCLAGWLLCVADATSQSAQPER